MKVSTLLYAATIFIFFMAGGVHMIGVLGQSKSALINDEYTEFNKSINLINELSTEVDTMEGGLDQDPDWGLFGSLNALIQSSWNTISQFPTILSFVVSMFGAMAAFFGIPGYVLTIISVIISLSTIFAVWAAIFQKDT